MTRFHPAIFAQPNLKGSHFASCTDIGIMILGVDFDNTLVSYDGLMHRLALEQGLLRCSAVRGKKAIRDAIRGLPEGETAWRRLQALAYGPRMGEATLIDGVLSFVETCSRNNVPVYIISHKSEYATEDVGRTNLRTAALDWMTAHGLFNGRGLRSDHVFFEGTRAEKLDRIQQLGCTHFVDDLEETFLEASFPRGVQKILLSSYGAEAAGESLTVLNNWEAVTRHLFHDPSN